MTNTSDLRVAWLFPSLEGGNYWHPVFSEFTKFFKHTTVYTGKWTGFSSGFEDAFKVQVVGQTQFIEVTSSQGGYGRGVSYVSPNIGRYLHQFKPHVVFTSGFSIWTLFTVMLKPVYRWRVVIAYEGSSPNVDYRNSAFRIWLRRKMVKLADAYITNSHAGKAYLTELLKADEDRVFSRPYEVPDSKALTKLDSNSQLPSQQSQKLTFLFAGQLIPRKGLHLLLQACVILKSRGYQNYRLQVIGKGPLREELETFSQEHNLPVEWLGQITYGQVGSYFRNADVFVLPTLEDTWGMVVLEAMAFGKPIICSKLAGASELVIDAENGYLVDPQQPEELAKVLQNLIEHPELLPPMGERSQQIISQYTPQSAAIFLAEVVSFALGNQ